MPKIDLGEIFTKAFSFSFSFKRILPFFIFNIIFASVFILTLFSVSSALKDIASLTMIFSYFLTDILLFTLSIIILVLIFIYLQGSVITNAKNYYSGKEEKFTLSIRKTKSRYLSLLGVVFLTGIISFAVLIIPLIGTLIAIFLSITFFLTAPAAVIGKKNPISSIQESIEFFSKNKANTTIIWLLLSIISIIFLIVSIIPLTISLIPIFISAQSMGLINAIKSNLLIIYIGSVIASLIIAFLTVFSLSTQSFYYMNIKRKIKS